MMPYEPVRIGIFGSVARNEDRETSDIDILYNFKNTIGFSNLLDLQEYLEKTLTKKVDLVDERFINPRLKPHIINDLRIIYDNGR